jgi:eukaryotic-like serine/threonine-protein kinase
MKECPRCRICFADSIDACPLDGATLEDGFPGEPIVDSKYRVEQRLGRGGMGVVYRVRHLGLQKEFALKLIHIPRDPGQSFAKRFQTEAKALGRLKHSNIVEVTDYGVDPRGSGFPYLVMEYLEGTTLREKCHKQGALSVPQLLPIFAGIAAGIDFAHQRGVLHRDLKPANVFLMQSADGEPTAKILDFGLARLVEQSRDLKQIAASAASTVRNPPERR